MFREFHRFRGLSAAPDCSSAAVPSGTEECGNLRELAASCRDIEAGVFADRPAQDDALSSLLHGKNAQDRIATSDESLAVNNGGIAVFFYGSLESA